MRRLLTPLIAVLLLAGCGGSDHHAHARAAVASPVATSGHTCTPHNYAMQCALAGQPAPALTFSAPFGAKYGWDFAWSCPSPGTKAFGWSYLSPDTSKNWTRACVDLYHSHGAATVAGWESSATRSLQGFSAGFSDARNASAQLAALGAPAGQPFVLAIDFDASGPDVASYFAGAKAAEPGRTGAYGGYRPLLYLYQHGLVDGLNFQTYGWSRGLWLPALIAPLEQYLNSSSVDYDRALSPDYGQWPRPRVGPSPDQVARWVRARGGSLHAYYAHGCRRPILTSGTCGRLAWRVNHFQLLIDTAKGYDPRCFGHGRNLGAAVCQIVRPAVAIRSRARTATFQALGAKGCESGQRRVHDRVCNPLWQRYDYFDRRARRSVATSRL